MTDEAAWLNCQLQQEMDVCSLQSCCGAVSGATLGSRHSFSGLQTYIWKTTSLALDFFGLSSRVIYNINISCNCTRVQGSNKSMKYSNILHYVVTTLLIHCCHLLMILLNVHWKVLNLFRLKLGQLKKLVLENLELTSPCKSKVLARFDLNSADGIHLVKVMQSVRIVSLKNSGNSPDMHSQHSS